jgi:dCMP deaminase
MTKNRVNKSQYYINIAREVAQRATCLRKMFGAIIVKDDQIVATGYNGAPRKTKSCHEHKFCLRERMNIPSGSQYEICRSVHAEQNAIINAARAGVSILGGDIYLFGQSPEGETEEAFPCFICKKMIINAGINQLITCDKSEKLQMYSIKDWVEEWSSVDILDSSVKYK